MFYLHAKKLLLGSAFVLVAMLGLVDPASAQNRRVSWDPDYGAPFSDLGWRGEAIVQFGSCDGPGNETLISCPGGLSFTSATVELYDKGTPGTTLQTINFTGGQVALLTFDGSNELTDVWSSPFNPQQGAITQSKYDGSNQAWFSLIFVGKYAQLMWFDENPGNALLDPLNFPYVQLPNALTYAGCYFFGVNAAGWKKDCGISSVNESAGAVFKVTEVPEPGTYALLLAGLGAVAFVARRRARR